MVSEVKTAARFDDRVANYVAYRPGLGFQRETAKSKLSKL
jgi:hypothetical protein